MKDLLELEARYEGYWKEAVFIFCDLFSCHYVKKQKITEKTFLFIDKLERSKDETCIL